MPTAALTSAQIASPWVISSSLLSAVVASVVSTRRRRSSRRRRRRRSRRSRARRAAGSREGACESPSAREGSRATRRSAGLQQRDRLRPRTDAEPAQRTAACQSPGVSDCESAAAAQPAGTHCSRCVRGRQSVERRVQLAAIGSGDALEPTAPWRLTALEPASSDHVHLELPLSLAPSTRLDSTARACERRRRTLADALDRGERSQQARSSLRRRPMPSTAALPTCPAASSKRAIALRRSWRPTRS